MALGSSMIDPTITVGNIIEISTILLGGIVVFTNVRSRVDTLGKDVSEMRVDMKALSKTVTEVAVVSNRLNRLEGDVSDLRRGRGFIQEEILGEYPRSSIP